MIHLTVPDEEPVDIDGENGEASMEHKTADTSKTSKRSKKSKGESAKGKPKTKKRKKSSEGWVFSILLTCLKCFLFVSKFIRL